jgi:hypothetical protein
MLFFDLAMMILIGAAVVAAVVGGLVVVSTALGRDKPEGDCREQTLILYGEGHRDCE